LHLNKKTSLVTLAFSLAALPLLAAHSYSTGWSPAKNMTIGTTQIQPGQYDLKAEEGKSELQVVHNGKVIATVPFHWTTPPAKQHDSQVGTDGDKVTDVEFAGTTAAVQIN
jgi:hypothetical protein